MKRLITPTAGGSISAVLLIAGFLVVGARPASVADDHPVVPVRTTASTCAAGPEYYEIALVSTRKLPGTFGSSGVVEVGFSPSPFGVALSPAGEYLYDLRFVVKNIRRPAAGKQYVAWLSTPNLDQVVHVGPLNDQFTVDGAVSFNKYLVIVSLEDEGYSPDRWSGPIVLRGLSRSGKMHTSIGHGLFQDEPCTQYGFN